MPRPKKARKTAAKKTAHKRTTKRTKGKRKATRSAGKKHTRKTMGATPRDKKALTLKTSVITGKALSKSQVISELSETAAISRTDVKNVLMALSNLIDRHVTKRAVGEFALPGLLKIRVVHKPATKARKGINPFTGEETMFKAKPARNVIKIKALKNLKDMAA